MTLQILKFVRDLLRGLCGTISELHRYNTENQPDAYMIVEI
jgi:hypothetical protein